MIKLIDVRAGYENKEVIHGVNVTFEPGKITALIGPNGCGKSTMLKTLVRIIGHTGGKVLVDGEVVEQLSAAKLARKVAYLPQNKKAPDITVRRMVLHGRFAYLSYPRRYREQDMEIAQKALRWAGMEHKGDEIVSRLSGGMQQKVYIAMALAQDADTVLMDEPTAYLDVAHQLRLMELVKKLAADGKAVVVILHDLTQALQIADKVVVMKDGKIIAQGTADEVYESGSLQSAFEVRVERIETQNQWTYFCRLKE